MLAQYEDSMNFDDQYIHDAIEMLSTSTVICPVCQKYEKTFFSQVLV